MYSHGIHIVVPFCQGRNPVRMEMTNGNLHGWCGKLGLVAGPCLAEAGRSFALIRMRGESRGFARRLARHAEKRVREQFSLEAFCEKFLFVLDQCSSSSRTSGQRYQASRDSLRHRSHCPL